MEINRKERQENASVASDPPHPNDTDDGKPHQSLADPLALASIDPGAMDPGPIAGPAAASVAPSSLRADALSTWRRTGQLLSAIIGESGFCALFERAVRLQTARYQWLRTDPACRSIAPLLALFEHDLARADEVEAAIANKELLQAFTKQLSALIGEALTAQLLHDVAALKPELPDSQEQV